MPRFILSLLLTLGSVFLTTICNAARGEAAGDFVWIEGESPTSVVPADFQFKTAEGSPVVLSGGKWLSIEGSKAAAAIPENGVELHYTFVSPRAADYTLWTHIGYEQTRSPCDWQIDNGPWQEIPREAPTVDLQEIGVWAPVAWLNLGKQSLTAGNHEIVLRIRKSGDAKAKTDAVLFGLDAFCITAGAFHPDGVIKPGDISWMTPADKAAAEQTFAVPVPTDAGQTSVSLAGQWQYAGDDETVVEDRLGPTKTLPDSASLTWHSIQIPSDRNTSIPTDEYVHRFYLRTRVSVPAGLSGHSFVLHIPDQKMIATVFVNGQICGWTKNPGASWDCDVTRAIKPGQTNEIQVAIKDSFYGLELKGGGNHLAYTPYTFWHYNLTHSLDMPLVPHYYAGLARVEPSLVVGGQVYTSDVFAKPSLQKKNLGLEVTVHNPTDNPIDVVILNQVQPLAGGPVEKTFAPVTLTVPAEQDATTNLTETWANPKLWWPDDPQQYDVITELAVHGKTIDQRKTKFGFREWTWDGPDFKLNGIPWHGFADVNGHDIATLKKRGQNMVRVWATDENTEKYLDDCDAQGMCVRRTGIFDGEGAAYNLKNPALWDNYRQQMIPWIKSQRNHPSIFIWSIENEITFINGHVMGEDKLTTAEIKKSYELFQPVDPTRPMMTDGGNALLDESMPVYGGHYMEPKFNTLPESAYDKSGYTHRQVWPITQQKPILFGEAEYLAGDTPADLATVGGEEAAIGPAESRPAGGTILRMLSEAYRWNDISFHFWTENETDFYNAWAHTAVFSRQWGWTFNSGQSVQRKLGIFNDTRSDAPITFTWVLSLGGKDVSTNTSVHHVPAGGNEKFDVSFEVPAVTQRQEGTWTLTLARDGKAVFRDVKNVSVLSPPADLVHVRPVPPSSVGVYDPKGNVKTFLSSIGVPVLSVENLKQIPGTAKVLIIGPDALDAQNSTSNQFAQWAAGGNVVIVLEQKNPLQFQGLPGEMSADENHGCMAFAEDLTSPVLDGLQQKDLSCWGSDNWTYRDAYVKPTSGGKSLVQCDNHLDDTALAQMQSGEGIMLLSQLLIGEKIQDNAVAQRLLVNMVRFGLDYKLSYRDTVVVADTNPQLVNALNSAGLQFTKSPDALSALVKPQSLAVIDANPANLATLASNLAKVNAFTQDGGWIILNRLTPDGLSDFNKLVGVNHLIRPFRAEKVTWPAQRNPLTAGLPAINVVLGTGKKIMSFAPPEFPDPNAYSYVVDLDDIAPFCTSTYGAWNNAVNGFTQNDGAWQLIENMPPEKAVMPITLPRPEKIQQIIWCSDNNYEGCTQIEVEINGRKYPFDTQPNGEEQTFAIPDQPTADRLTIRIIGWEHHSTKSRQELVGIDNVWIKVARPADFFDKVKPMLNIGAMVEYPQGRGGVILCNVNFRDSEENPANIVKKRTVIATLLRNLQAKFSGGQATLATANLHFSPIDISHFANQYRGEEGWFGDKKHTFEALPSGKQQMAGVSYDIYHFTTSIVPEAIMLKGNGSLSKLPASVTGIPVNQKADALFFLQAAHLQQKPGGNDRKRGKKLEIADYIIHYADGTSEKAPVYAGIGVEDYHQQSPTPLPGAQIAWQQPYEESDGFAVAYSMQWNNPHPDLEISSIDLVYGPDKRGVPALLAITAGSAK
jgi:beta-galactosidase